MAVALAVGLGLILALSVGAAAFAWRTAGVDIGVFGWVVAGVGAFLSVALGAGLMALAFFSARRGYDDGADGGGSH